MAVELKNQIHFDGCLPACAVMVLRAKKLSCSGECAIFNWTFGPTNAGVSSDLERLKRGIEDHLAGVAVDVQEGANWEALQTAIEAGKLPLAIVARDGQHGELAHCVVAEAYDATAETITYADPWPPSQRVAQNRAQFRWKNGLAIIQKR